MSNDKSLSSENQGAQMVAFDCPGCGETTGIETDDPESLESKIFECGGCGENVLLNNYVGEKNE